MKNIIAGCALALAVGAVGCKGNDSTAKTDQTLTTLKPIEKPAADNTARNDRDPSTALTADNTGQASSDVDLTARLRRAIMDEPGLSTNAQNAKLIVDGGKVTLRGPVATAVERDRVVALAVGIFGAPNVDAQLELAP